MEEDKKRGTGRTTGLMLEALGKASLSPGRWVKFTDHYQRGQMGCRHLARYLRAMADRLELKYQVRVTGCDIEVKSTVASGGEA